MARTAAYHTSPADIPRIPHKFKQSAMPLSPRPLAFVGLVGIFASGLTATPRQWIEPKISRKSAERRQAALQRGR